MPYRLALLALIVAAWTAAMPAQTGPAAPAADAEVPTTWTFDTYTPGPCSPTGARHGGCNPGESASA